MADGKAGPASRLALFDRMDNPVIRKQRFERLPPPVERPPLAVTEGDAFAKSLVRLHERPDMGRRYAMRDRSLVLAIEIERRRLDAQPLPVRQERRQEIVV